MRRWHANLVSVEGAAIGLGVAPRTVRRWLKEQRLEGCKIGGTWGVVWPEARRGEAEPSVATSRLLYLRQRLRHLGERLIMLGNQEAGAKPQQGHVFLTWRRARSLQLIFALGRRHPLHAWAPRALRTDLPFWHTKRRRWSRVFPLLRCYERARQWCPPDCCVCLG